MAAQIVATTCSTVSPRSLPRARAAPVVSMSRCQGGSWLAHSGEALRTRLGGVHGHEQLGKNRERPTQLLDLPLVAAPNLCVRQHAQAAADPVATSVPDRDAPAERHGDGPGAQRA